MNRSGLVACFCVALAGAGLISTCDGRPIRASTPVETTGRTSESGNGATPVASSSEAGSPQPNSTLGDWWEILSGQWELCKMQGTSLGTIQNTAELRRQAGDPSRTELERERATNLLELTGPYADDFDVVTCHWVFARDD